jgi:cell division protein FtsI (penicillin-binding protein 3)
MNDLDIDYEGKKPDTYLTKIKSSDNAIHLEENPVSKEKVPDVRGMGARDAVYLLESSGLQVRLIGIGKVKSQSLLPGYKFKKGQTIMLKMG